MNKFKLSSYHKEHVVTKLLSRAMILIEKICKNLYVADFNIARINSLTCLSARGQNPEAWHKSLSHVSVSPLDKLVSGNLVRCSHKIKFVYDKVCDAGVKRNRSAHPSGGINKLLIFQRTFRAEVVNATCFVTKIRELRSLISLM